MKLSISSWKIGMGRNQASWCLSLWCHRKRVYLQQLDIFSFKRMQKKNLCMMRWNTCKISTVKKYLLKEDYPLKKRSIGTDTSFSKDFFEQSRRNDPSFWQRMAYKLCKDREKVKMNHDKTADYADYRTSRNGQEPLHLILKAGDIQFPYIIAQDQKRTRWWRKRKAKTQQPHIRLKNSSNLFGNTTQNFYWWLKLSGNGCNDRAIKTVAWKRWQISLLMEGIPSSRTLSAAMRS